MTKGPARIRGGATVRKIRHKRGLMPAEIAVTELEDGKYSKRR